MLLHEITRIPVSQHAACLPDPCAMPARISKISCLRFGQTVEQLVPLVAFFRRLCQKCVSNGAWDVLRLVSWGQISYQSAQ